jgi:hypothetical protein
LCGFWVKTAQVGGFMRKSRLYLALLGGLMLAACASPGGTDLSVTPSVPEVTEEGSVELQVSVPRPDVTRLEFFNNGRRIGEDTAAPFTQSVSFSFRDNGTQGFSVKATYADGSSQSANTSVSVNISHVRGRVHQTTRSGGSTLAGATVFLNFGEVKTSAITDVDGTFNIPVKGKPYGFDILVIPPVGAGLAALSYDSVPLSAYVSNLGASQELNIYLPGGPQAANPVAPPRWGCISGRVLDTDGITPVVGATAGLPNRTSPAACDGSRPANLGLAVNNVRFGETGLVTYRGTQAVRSGAGGNFLMPVVSGFNSFATEGFVWAGNYTGSDTGNPATANEVYWSKFAYVPQVKTFINSGQTTNAGDLRLENFDPATNPRVAAIQFSHDTSKLSGFDFSLTGNALSLTNVSFESSITGGDVRLGQYFDFTGGPRNLRVYKIPSGAQAQTIITESQALELDAAGNLSSFSVVNRWFNGTNLSRPATADFMATPILQSPANGATGVSQNPRLTWKAVDRPALYGVTIYDATSGAPILVTYTPETFLNIYQVKLAPGEYLWDVTADENAQMLDYIAVGPEVLQAGRYLNLTSAGFKREGLKGSAINTWRGQLADSFVATQGFVPQTYGGGGSNYIVKLLENGYRFSASQTYSFTVGN